MTSRGKIGRVNQILKRGTKFIDKAAMAETIRAARPLAAVWYARIALPQNERWLGQIFTGKNPNRVAVAALQQHWNATQDSRWLHPDQSRPDHYIHVDGLLGERTRSVLSELIARNREAQDQLAVIEDAIGEELSDLKPLYSEFMPVLFSTGRVDLDDWRQNLETWAKWRRSSPSTEQWDAQEFWNVCDLATVDYRLKSPRSRATRRWQTGFRRSPNGYDDPVVLCAYCKANIATRQQGSNKDYTRQTNPHTLSCGLWLLAFDEPIDVTRDRVIRDRELLRKRADTLRLSEMPMRDAIRDLGLAIDSNMEPA